MVATNCGGETRSVVARESFRSLITLRTGPSAWRRLDGLAASTHRQRQSRLRPRGPIALTHRTPTARPRDAPPPDDDERGSISPVARESSSDDRSGDCAACDLARLTRCRPVETGVFACLASHGRHSAHAVDASADLPQRSFRIGRVTQHSTPALKWLADRMRSTIASESRTLPDTSKRRTRRRSMDGWTTK